MEIVTTRFGKIRTEESEWIVMKGEIIGFGHLRRFALLVDDENAPFSWLQSVDDPAIAFVVVNPRIVKRDYAPAILERDRELLDIQKPEEIALLSIVTIRSAPLRATANLRAPILVNSSNKSAKQIVLDDPDNPIQYDISAAKRL